MDKSKIGWLLLFGMMALWMYFSNGENERMRQLQEAYNDSIAAVEKAKKLAEKQASDMTPEQKAQADSIALVQKTSALGVFAAGAQGSEELVELQNSVVKLVLSSKGAIVKSATLLKYQTYDGKPLEFISEGEMAFNMTFPMTNGYNLNTSEVNFSVKSKTDTSVVFSLNGGGASLDFVYELNHDDYMVDFDVVANNCSAFLKPEPTVPLVWSNKRRQMEKGRMFENRYSRICYKAEGEIQDLSEASDDQASIKDVKWIAFKDQFFSAVLIADKKMGTSSLRSEMEPDSSIYMKNFMANVQVPFSESASFRYFIGPNWYKLLKSYDKHLSGDDKLELKRMVPLGWGIFRWVNQFLTIPLFNFFGSFIANFGIVILLLTIVVKSLLFPLTYKSYLSSAMMRVLKPEMDKINAKYPENSMEKSQAISDLYKRSGVNPLGGCLPLILSMPILVALFYFFPTAIELRQQSFLWAEDLSSYDAIVTFPFSIPFVGDHLSLFCILMTVTNLVYMKYNMQMTDTGAMQQMPMMKYMMYIMPIWFFFLFNDYSSGLTYYYLLSQLITIVQTLIIRRSVDDKKILQTIEANRSNPNPKKGWMERIAEEARRRQEEAMRQAQANRENRN